MRISDWSSDVCSSDLGFRMADLLDEWQSFWDIASPQQAATAMASTYGEAARQAALQCVAAAAADGRVVDSRFWCAVARQLRGTTDGVPTTTAATESLGRAAGAEPSSCMPAAPAFSVPVPP